MDVSKRKSLESAGWKIGDAADFLEMSDNEKQLLDQRLDLMAKSNIMNFYLDVKGNQNGDMREQILSWSNEEKLTSAPALNPVNGSFAPACA